MKIKFLLLQSFIFVLFASYGQIDQSTSKIDSLYAVLQSQIEDTTRIKTLHAITLHLEAKSKEAAITYARKALIVAKTMDQKEYECQAHTRIADLIQYENKGKTALAHLDSTYRILKSNLVDSIRNPQRYYFELANAMATQASIYKRSGQSGEALKLLIKSLSIWTKSKKQTKTVSALLDIGTLFFHQGKFDDALHYYEQSLDLAKKLADNNVTVTVLGNVGIAHGASGNLKKAIEYFKLQLFMAEELEKPSIISTALGNLGTAYTYSEQYEKALEVASRSLEIAEQTKDKRLMAYGNEIIAGIHMHLNHPDIAMIHNNTAIQLAKEVNENPLLKNLYENITEIYVSQSDFERAFEYQSKLIAVKDTLFDEKNSKAITEMQTKYETEKKEQENELLKTEKQIHEDRNKFLAAGILFVLVALGLVLYQFRLKRKANEKLLVKNKIIRDKNKTIVDSINYAKMIQTAVLPELTTIKSHFPESFLFFKPKDVVSGDFYWMFEKENQVLFAAADCTGHGVPGAFMSLICINLLNEIASNQESPAGILNDMSVRLIQHLKQDASKNSSVNDGLDIALCAFDKKTNKLTFSGAHNPLYLVRDSELTEYKGDRLHIGVHQKVGREFTQTTIEMKQNDIIYLFSDGFPDQPGGVKGKKFYYPPFQKLLLTNHQLPMEQQAGILASTIKEFQGNKGQVDDMLVMGVKF
ncbi:tetratricopeptide repeat protein [Flavobacteriales bacterium]|nr:tetratricopeptide repeat protein [Flavobacteriales bacterium]